MVPIRRLEMHVAHACNLSCESCSHYSNYRHKGLVPLADAERWLDAWKSRVTPQRFTLLGGEPTLHPDLTEFVRLARRTWPSSQLRLVTNGWFLHRHPGLPAALADHPDATILVSVHHDSPEYRAKLDPIFELTGAWARDYGLSIEVERSFQRWTRRYRGAGREMEPYEDGDPQKSWENCLARFTPQLHEGKLWKCAPLAYLGQQHRTVGLSEKWAPYLAYEPLSPDCSDEELREFLGRRQESHCAMCPANPERLELPVPFTTSGPPAPGKLADVPPPKAVEPPSVLHPRLRGQVVQLEMPLRASAGRQFQSFPVLHGSTEMVADFECHASVLAPGMSPHPPHEHAEEEILIVLDGLAELVLRAPGPEVSYARLLAGPGEFIFYPPFSSHTIYNAGPTPLSYLMFRWRSAERDDLRALGRSHYRFPAEHCDFPPAGIRLVTMHRILDSRTRYLDKLHCHCTQMLPGGGYSAHVDPHDIAIVVLQGAVECMGRRVRQGGVLYIPAGEPHDMVNRGGEAALYLVFEFQSERARLSVEVPAGVLQATPAATSRG